MGFIHKSFQKCLNFFKPAKTVMSKAVNAVKNEVKKTELKKSNHGRQTFRGWGRGRTMATDARGHALTAMQLRMRQICGCDLVKAGLIPG